MIEVLAVEIVNGDRHARGAHERVEFSPLEEGVTAGLELVAIILPDYTLAGLRIIGFADTREQQLLGVAKYVGGEHDQASGLLVFVAGLHVGIKHPGHALGLLVIEEFGDEDASSQFELRICPQHRQHVDVG